MDYANPWCVAYGTLNMAGAAGTQFLGPLKGFTQANAVDNGAGDWTVGVDPDTANINAAATGGQFFTFGQIAATGGVTAAAAQSVEIVTATLGTATPQVRIRALDAGAMAVDIVTGIMFWRGMT